MTALDDLLARIEAAAAAATPGPWRSSRKDMHSWLMDGTPVNYLYRGEHDKRVQFAGDNCDEDSDFCALSHAWVPQLAAMLREARGALQYIVDKAEHAEKPKWGNEFVDVARLALARLDAMAKGEVERG